MRQSALRPNKREFEKIVGEMDDRRRRNGDRHWKEEREGRHENCSEPKAGKQCHARYEQRDSANDKIVHQHLLMPRSLRGCVNRRWADGGW